MEGERWGEKRYTRDETVVVEKLRQVVKGKKWKVRRGERSETQDWCICNV